jgi:hypothetical protein
MAGVGSMSSANGGFFLAASATNKKYSPEQARFSQLKIFFLRGASGS